MRLRERARTPAWNVSGFGSSENRFRSISADSWSNSVSEISSISLYARLAYLLCIIATVFMRPRYAYQDRNYELRSLRSTFKVDTFWFPKCEGLGRGQNQLAPEFRTFKFTISFSSSLLIHEIPLFAPKHHVTRPECFCKSGEKRVNERRMEKGGEKKLLWSSSLTLSHCLPQSVVHSHYMERTTNNCPLILWTPQKLLQLARESELYNKKGVRKREWKKYQMVRTKVEAMWELTANIAGYHFHSLSGFSGLRPLNMAEPLVRCIRDISVPCHTMPNLAVCQRATKTQYFLFPPFFQPQRGEHFCSKVSWRE